MPRRRIINENDAAKLLADAAMKCLNGKISEAKLNSITNTVNAFCYARKQRRDSVREQKGHDIKNKLMDELEIKMADSLGPRINYHQQIAGIKMK